MKFKFVFHKIGCLYELNEILFSSGLTIISFEPLTTCFHDNKIPNFHKVLKTIKRFFKIHLLNGFFFAKTISQVKLFSMTLKKQWNLQFIFSTKNLVSRKKLQIVRKESFLQNKFILVSAKYLEWALDCYSNNSLTPRIYSVVDSQKHEKLGIGFLLIHVVSRIKYFYFSNKYVGWNKLFGLAYLFHLLHETQRIG